MSIDSTTACDEPLPPYWGGNNIPDSHLRKFSLRGCAADPDRDEPEDGDLARFIRDQL